MSSSSASSAPRDPDLERLEERSKDDVAYCQNLFWNCIEQLDSPNFVAADLFSSSELVSSAMRRTVENLDLGHACSPGHQLQMITTV